MRMTRARQRHLALQRRRAQAKYPQKTLAAMLASVAAGSSLPAEASVMTVLQDFKADFDYMQDQLVNIEAFDQAKAYAREAALNVQLAQAELEQSEQYCRDAEANLALAKENQQLAEENVRLIEKQLQDTQNRRQALTQAAISRQQAVADYLPTWYEAQAQLQDQLAIQQAASYEHVPGDYAGTGTQAEGMSQSDQLRVQWIQQAWEEVGFAPNRLSEIEARYNQLNAGDVAAAGTSDAQGAIDAYWARVDAINAEVEAAQGYFDSVSDTLDQLKEAQQEAEEAEAEARQEILEYQVELGQAKQDLYESQQDVALCWQDQIAANEARFAALKERNQALSEAFDARYNVKHFGEGIGVQHTLDYYNWQGQVSGHQLYKGTSFFMSKNNYDFSLSSGYAVSQTGLSGGDMSGYTDTAMSLMYNNKHPRFDVRYGMEINLPTGDSRVAQNAVPPDLMARVTRLGEGWNFTPMIAVTRHLDKLTSWTWRGAYAVRGSYSDNKEDLSSVVHPGNVWHNELELLHTDQQEQYLVKLHYAKNNHAALSSREASYNYTEGDSMYGRAYYRRWFAPKDSMGCYMAFAYDKAGAYDNHDITSNGIHRLYYGVGWFHQFDRYRQLRLFANWLRSEGEAYDPLTKQGYSSGRRFSVSLGYDWRLDDRNSLSLNVERSVLRQQGEANYRGWGISVMYNRNF